VDHRQGVDDVSHGHASGTCAYRTLTYALERCTGGIELAGTDIFPGGVSGEAAPFVLVGRVALHCNGARFTWPSVQASYDGLISMAGSADRVDGCLIDGASLGGYCVVVSTSDSVHTFDGNTVTNCGNVGVNVSAGVQGVSFTNNAFSANNDSIIFEGNNAGALTGNTMASTNIDVYCADGSPGLTGSANSGIAGPIDCIGCSGCPF
jgi:hypothetical protein